MSKGAMLALAISITAKAFENKVDKGGNPYILHCLRVMNSVGTKNEEKACAAVLHDLVEDCPEWTCSKLSALGFTDKVVGIIYLLTREKTTPYMEYIKAISVDKDASEIKIADLRDNSDITRLKGLRKKDMDRIEKYHAAYVYLLN